MQKLSHQIHCFAEFTLDLTRGCLLCAGEEIKLRPKSFEVLKYLIENNRRLISKDELIHAVWVETAVTDGSLVQCLKDIRHALGDEAQQFVKTVHGRGYVFDREVSDDSPLQVTTYTEETAGVQVIIEEGTNGHGDGATRRRGDASAPLPAQSKLGYLSAAIGQHRWPALVGVLTLAVVAAGIVYFSRPGAAIDSIAVMPFVNVSGDPNTEYLSDGISESIINSLSPNLKVIALNSVLRYKGKQTDPQGVGRDFNVRAVVMGRLTQRGDDLTISVELVDVRDNRHLWGQQYNRKLADITAVQAEIAQEISGRLRLRLSGEEEKRLTKRYTENSEAYQLYVMGRYFRRTRSEKGFQKSVEFFEQAITKDPNYAPAYAGLAMTYAFLGGRGLLAPKEAMKKEEWAALKALEIDNDLAEAHTAMAALVRKRDLNWSASEEEFKLALELNPNSGDAHQNYAMSLAAWGRFDEAMLHLKRAQEIDPLSPITKAEIGNLFYFSRQYDLAIEQFQKIIEMDPNFAPAHNRLQRAYLAKGMYEEAITEQKKAIASDPPEGSWGRTADLGYAYAVAGKRDEAQKILDELKELAKQRYVPPNAFAVIYMGLGDKDQAFAWLDKTFEARPDNLYFLKVSPQYDSLRSDPRFAELLRRLKLAP